MGQHYRVVKSKSDEEFRAKSIVLYSTEVANDVMSFAMQIIVDKALIAGEPDGEDTAGRARLKRATVDGIVSFAFDLAQATFDEGRRRGLMFQIPDLNELNATVEKTEEV